MQLISCKQWNYSKGQKLTPQLLSQGYIMEGLRYGSERVRRLFKAWRVIPR